MGGPLVYDGLICADLNICRFENVLQITSVFLKILGNCILGSPHRAAGYVFMTTSHLCIHYIYSFSIEYTVVCVSGSVQCG
jgi:hypothetical protein